jgi:hypothetical protein
MLLLRLSLMDIRFVGVPPSSLFFLLLLPSLLAVVVV